MQNSDLKQMISKLNDEVQRLIAKQDVLKTENQQLRNELKKLNQSDLFNSLEVSDKIALKMKIDQYINRIDSQIEKLS